MKILIGKEQSVADHSFIPSKVKFVGTRKEEASGAGRIKSEKLREEQCKKDYVRVLENKIVE